MDFTVAEAEKRVPKKKFDKGQPFDYKGKHYTPKYNPRTGELQFYNTTYGSLVAKQRQEKLKLENSLSRFFHGHNMFDLTLLQTQAVINQIEEETGISSKKFRLIYFEFGLNIETSFSPLDIISIYKSHRGKKCVLMTKNGKVYGIEFRHKEYRIKMYAKTEEQKEHYKRTWSSNNVLRIEIAMSGDFMRKIVHSLHDLTLRKNWKKLFSLFMKKINELEKLPFIDYGKLSTTQLQWQCARENPNYWKHLKRNNPSTYDTYRKRYKVAMKKYTIDIDREIQRKLKKHFRSLLNNTFVPKLEACNIVPKRGQLRLKQ